MKKHAITISAALAAVVLVPILTAGPSSAASETAAPMSGSANADGPQTRGATVVVGGGTWSYGVDRYDVFSAYDNKKLVHSTSVKSSGKTNSSGRVAKGKIAWASRTKALFGNQSFWNIY